jgi:hypothetical protein
MIREMLELAATSASYAENKLENIFAHELFSLTTHDVAGEQARRRVIPAQRRPVRCARIEA